MEKKPKMIIDKLKDEIINDIGNFLKQKKKKERKINIMAEWIKIK